MVYANGRTPVHTALEGGCHSIEHGFFMGRENLELMAEKQIAWVPTVFAMKSCLENINREYKQADPAIAEKNLHHQLDQLAVARECEVTLALGTDSGSIGVLHCEAVAEELRLFIKAGFTLSEAVRCATYNGAQLLGIENSMGLIDRGRPANFIVARGNPAQLQRRLSYLEAIYMNGTPARKIFFIKFKISSIPCLSQSQQIQSDNRPCLLSTICLLRIII